MRERQVKYEDALARAHELGGEYIEVSAKTRNKMTEFYELMVRSLPPFEEQSPSINLKDQEKDTVTKCYC